MLCELSGILGSEVEMSVGLISRIVSEVVSLSEQEPCGVRGGAIVVLFSSESHPVGRIQVDLTGPIDEAPGRLEHLLVT